MGKDEPRIKVDGDPVWNGVVAKDGSVTIGVKVPFEDQASEDAGGLHPQHREHGRGRAILAIPRAGSG